MRNLKDFLAGPGRFTVAGAPDGHVAVALSEIAEASPARCVLHIVRDDARMARLNEALGFFAPDLTRVSIPAWDCLPYDRTSPSPEIAAARVDGLTEVASRLRQAGGLTEPLVVLTTISAVLQRVPPPETLLQSAASLGLGDEISTDNLLEVLARNGFVRAETVREPGEFALRGGIVDLYPPGVVEPLRLDFFGDQLETIRTFDPATQRTIGNAESVTIKPMSEVPLDPDAISRFRDGYRAAFGAIRDDDPLYESVSAGRKYAGMEHWLPLFLDATTTTLGYLPDAVIGLDHQLDDAMAARWELIGDYYDNRKRFNEAGAESSGGAPYRPLPPGGLYVTREEWDMALADRSVAAFSPFGGPDESAVAIDAGGRPALDFAEARARQDQDLFSEVEQRVVAERKFGRRVLFACATAGSRDRLLGLLADHGVSDPRYVDSAIGFTKDNASPIGAAVLPLENGFVTDTLAVITDSDILGDRLTRSTRRRRRKAEEFLSELSDLQDGDFVVHIDHGIGRYEGLQTLDVGGAPHDCLAVGYEGGDRLFVPVENIEVLSRFGSADMAAQLDRLGAASWQARKARVKKRVRDIADGLIKVAAERALRSGVTMPTPEGLYEEFCASFPYEETDDQLRALEDTLEDLASGQPMDRLICGDVGFGKTEVALRAAFVAAMTGHQVAVVVPTTLLCRQHSATFKERFKGLPLRVEQVSRMVTPKQVSEVRAGLADGTVDVVVGTHAILAKATSFKRLGLLIVDEEQHFGVRQKERLKQLRADVHVLTLTATPIPRTLQMAMSGVRDMSVIATPPVDRLAVRTYVTPYDGAVIREALLRERYRGGQSFYVCPRIEDLGQIRDRLGVLVPELTFATAHGQMSATELDDVMNAFYEGKIDILLSTNIVESGLDVPTANTMVIHRADMFGLAQLYQLRGRVGRAKQRAYAYLTLPPGRVLGKAAQKRLQVMETLDSLGAGFTVASHDLDIRGAGNLLGEEQSGNVREVGIELYQSMLEEAVAAARGGIEDEAREENWTPQISIGMTVLIPEAYVADLGVRLGLYRRISQLSDPAEIESFAAEMIDRFGPLPDAVDNLLKIIAIKQLCRSAGVEKVDAGPKGGVVAFRNNEFANPEGLVRFIAGQSGTVSVRPDHRLVYRRNWEDASTRMRGVHQLLKQLDKIATKSKAAA